MQSLDCLILRNFIMADDSQIKNIIYFQNIIDVTAKCREKITFKVLRA